MVEDRWRGGGGFWVILDCCHWFNGSEWARVVAKFFWVLVDRCGWFNGDSRSFLVYLSLFWELVDWFGWFNGGSWWLQVDVSFCWVILDHCGWLWVLARFFWWQEVIHGWSL